MRKISVTKKEEGLRLDKLAMRYLSMAPKSFIYKMLRKKNITLNGKRAEGSERLRAGDELFFYLSDETIEKFQSGQTVREKVNPVITKDNILYEDSDILIINKPAGLLSQKAKKDDVSLVEEITEYLIRENFIDDKELTTFKPAVCNRLDRNTSGIILAGKTTTGLSELGKLLAGKSSPQGAQPTLTSMFHRGSPPALRHQRNPTGFLQHNPKVSKYYLTIVSGCIKEEMRMSGWIKKEKNRNKADIYKQGEDGAKEIETEYFPIASAKDFTLLRVHLITGRSHQIRAQLANAGYPVIGDSKYGNKSINLPLIKKYGLKHHLLHANELSFGDIDGPLSYLSGKVFFAPLPEQFENITVDIFNGLCVGKPSGAAHKEHNHGGSICRDGIQEDSGARN